MDIYQYGFLQINGIIAALYLFCLYFFPVKKNVVKCVEFSEFLKKF